MMNTRIATTIKATGIELTPAIESYVEDKIAAVEKLVNDKDESAIADIEIGKTTEHHKSGEVFKAEINLHVAGKYLRAEAVKEDLYAAIDAVKDEIVVQLTSYQKKQQTLVKKGGRAIKNLLRGFYPRG